MISIPITLDQIIVAIKQLQPEDQAQVAEVLCQTGLRSDLATLIQELYDQSPDDDVTDADIMAEVKAVRQQAR
jgi:HEAT repeat protein